MEHTAESKGTRRGGGAAILGHGVMFEEGMEEAQR